MCLANASGRINSIYLLCLTYIALALLATFFLNDINIVRQINMLAWVQVHNASINWLSNNLLYGFYLLFICIVVIGYYTKKLHILRIAQAYFLAQLLGSVVLVNLFKRLVGHARPSQYVHQNIEAFSDAWLGPTLNAGYQSFPSGHACDYLTGCMFIALLLPKFWMRVLVILLAVVQGMFRVILAKHFPIDVLGGVIIALLSTYYVWTYWLTPRLQLL
jgi:membrane-associated phospholipid phosphatase